jgi:hypothetical protein
MPITEETKKTLLDGGFEYEVRMVIEDVRYMATNGVPDINSGIIRIPNVILVDVLVHIRILFEFFYGAENNENAHVKHYITNWDRDAPEEIGRWHGQINDFLSHLGYARVTRNYSYYPVANLLYPHYKQLVIDFLTQLDNEYRTPKLAQLLEDLRGNT